METKNIINSWDKMNVGTFLKIREINELNISDQDKNLKVAALLADITYEDIVNMPLSETYDLVESTLFLLEKPKPIKARRKYEVNGKTYMLMKSAEEMTTAQYINFNNLSVDGFEKHIPEMLALFLIPEGHQYNDGYDMDEVVDDMMSIGVMEAYGIADFFTKRYIRLMRCILVYLRLRIKWLRITARKKEKERIKAMELSLRLITGGLV